MNGNMTDTEMTAGESWLYDTQLPGKDKHSGEIEV